ncbi:MAG TPA: HIT domain-containing protein [Candidatus Kapabacteria bacterium]|jgi:ATP adenylyltransferase|nr:HIT domain-containing protein [Candidatus Kapabacteria bacterium]
MERLWSPWRSEFIQSAGREGDGAESPFTRAFNEPGRDEENYLLHRGERAFIILNRYPYNAGHLLIVPVRQVADFLELSDEERHEMIDLVRLGIDVLRRAMSPHAFNVGMNLGREAGAGIVNHVHMHIVPRWNGDTNFMPVLDETRHISEHMQETFRKLADARRSLVE